MTRKKPGAIPNVRWGEEETARVRQMLIDGMTYDEIVAALGNRTYAAVKSRVKWINLSKAERSRANALKRERRVFTPTGVRRDEIKKIEIPSHVLDDRNRRLMAERSLTAVLMGDPVFPAQSKCSGV